MATAREEGGEREEGERKSNVYLIFAFHKKLEVPAMVPGNACCHCYCVRTFTKKPKMWHVVVVYSSLCFVVVLPHSFKVKCHK